MKEKKIVTVPPSNGVLTEGDFAAGGWPARPCDAVAVLAVYA